MGSYVNPDNSTFARNRRAEIFIDKSGLIAFTNKLIENGDGRICVSRPRRFGKTRACSMLTAYYSRGCDSRELFHELTIENSPTFEEHLNRHHVIRLDIQELRLGAKAEGRHGELVRYIEEQVNAELAELFPVDTVISDASLAAFLLKIYQTYKATFTFLIDEWDVVYRDDRSNGKLKAGFTDFLRGLFKSAGVSECIDLVYMTGILPIQKQNTESALNNFFEYTMVAPDNLAEFAGFTESEVEALCQRYQMPFSEMRDWYDGYHFQGAGSVYCPASVVQAISRKRVGNYWTKTSTGRTLQDCLEAEMPGLKEAVGFLLAGQPVPVDPDFFENDIEHLQTVDDVLTLLVHLGYLSYNQIGETVSIPNREILGEFRRILKRIPGNPAWSIISASQQLLKDTLAMDADAVAAAIQSAHDYYASTLKYNNEDTLACVVLLAYQYAAEGDYVLIREFPGGKGFADILFLPKKQNLLPILIELKWKRDAESGIEQIRRRRYFDRLKGYREVLLVGISYENDSKKPGYKEHNCVIETKAIENI